MTPRRTGEIAFHHLVKGQSSGVRVATATVVRDQETWNGLWRSVTCGSSSPSEPPAVDWASRMVVFVGIGTRNTGGYQVEITRLYEEDDAIRVYMRETCPGPRAMVTCALTHPFHAVTSARRPDHVVFDFRLEIVTRE
ncbi:protease complex subunit PrcB family protein [Streptomyces sp. NPDC059441]|uniref:protease complex subunit PrcB family protein n=1 Tax=Streptomyces sp. NPDC059441 TaxID=3346829 RepID=UPI0036783767